MIEQFLGYRTLAESLKDDEDYRKASQSSRGRNPAEHPNPRPGVRQWWGWVCPLVEWARKNENDPQAMAEAKADFLARAIQKATEACISKGFSLNDFEFVFEFPVKVMVHGETYGIMEETVACMAYLFGPKAKD